MTAFPPPAMTYPSAVGGRRKAVPLDRDSPKPLPDVLIWRRLDKAGRGWCRHDHFAQWFWRQPRASSVASCSYRATKAGLTPWGRLQAAKGPTYPSCLHPSPDGAFWGAVSNRHLAALWAALRSITTRSAGREAVPAFPPPAMTYPSAVGGRRKAVPLDRDSPKPLPDVPVSYTHLTLPTILLV